MRSKIIFLLLMVFALAAGFSWAGDFWKEKDYRQWSKKECEQLLRDSPWATTRTISQVFIQPLQIGPSDPFSQTDASDPTTRGREANPRIEYVIQLRSALPIRQALVRVQQINQNYDALAPEQKQAFDADADKFLSTSFADRVVVHVSFNTNVQLYDRDLARHWQIQTTDTLRNFVFLITSRGEKVPLLHYAVAQSGRAFQFAFPREYEGRPLVGPQDKVLKLDFPHPSVGGQPAERIYREFKVSRMLIDEQVVY